MDNLLDIPLSEYIINTIAEKYDVLIFKGETKDNKIYVRLDKIYLIRRNFLFINDTGYGDNYELACSDLINLFLNTNYRIRFNDLYATTNIRNIIKSCYKKYNMKVGDEN
jgi:hypothetical protein